MAVGICTTLFAQRSYTPAEVDNGARLYEANCTRCHGADGDGVAGVNLGRGQFRRASTDDELSRIIINGIAGTAMPPGNFSDSQAGTIVAYLRSMPNTGARDAAAGDTGRGKAIFEGKGQCLTCHAIHGHGSRIGPDLMEIGAVRRVPELERAIVEPDADIRPENRAVRAVTRDGKIIQGRLFNQDSFSLQLLDADERLLSVQKSNLREFAILKRSPMPSYRDTLNTQELADVVGYLRSLKGRP